MTKKKTHEEYVAEVAAINPDIEVVGQYINVHTQILHYCKRHSMEWVAIPCGILKGQGCPNCKKEKISNHVKKTHEQYVVEVAAINPDIEIVGTYVDAKTKILHKCKRCNCEWSSTPNNILRGKGCPECGRKKMADSLRKTHEEYVVEVALINPNIEVIEKYSGNRNPIKHRWKDCNHVCDITPLQVLRGDGCPKCAHKIVADKLRKTHDEYVAEVLEVNSDIEVIGVYKNAATSIDHRCKTCGHVWSALPTNILRGRSCPACARKQLTSSLTKSHEEYVLEVSTINPCVEVVGVYVSTHVPISHGCRECGNVWDACPSNILRGQGCPECVSSKGEKLIGQWLDKNDIAYKSQKRFSDCRNKRTLPFDFYLPDYNVAIEYQGKQHYEPIDYFGGVDGLQGTIKRDEIKADYCAKNNITLITIPYYADIYEELNKLYELIMTKEAAA